MAGTLSRHKEVRLLGVDAVDGVRMYECPYCKKQGTWMEMAVDNWACDYEYTEEDLKCIG
jgi:hypothetical protein